MEITRQSMQLSPVSTFLESILEILQKSTIEYQRIWLASPYKGEDDWTGELSLNLTSKP